MEQLLANDVYKKQWYRACVLTHASCHAMAQKSATDHLRSSITHINFIETTSRLFQLQ